MGALDVVLYLASTALTSSGLAWIKRVTGAGLVEHPTLTGALHLGGAATLYFAGLGVWLWAMARNPLSTAYPIGIALSLVSATLTAALVLGEPVGWHRAVGIAIVLAGALCIGRSHARSPRPS